LSDQEAPREVDAAPEGSGAKDWTAPVEGGQLRGDVDINRLLDHVPAAETAALAERLIESKSKTDSRSRRDRIRICITIVVFGAIVLEAGAGVYIAAIAKSASWNDVKDWMTISLAPLVAAATVASSFWFPSREAD
jgi:hypothetical protein